MCILKCEGQKVKYVISRAMGEKSLSNTTKNHGEISKTLGL